MDEIEQIKRKIDIVEFIGGYITVKKTGRNFKALCPFHGEKSPSFVISPDRQIWHCFGCGLGGDAFTFLMKYENIEFGEAIKYLADRTGVKLTMTPQRSAQEEKKDRIYSLNNLAASFYHYLLTEHVVGKKALVYLTQTRKLPLALIKHWNIGYAPARPDALTNYLIKKKKYKTQDLVDAGLAGARYGRVDDFFTHRVMFPIQDVRGNIIAFSGRALESTTMPKYVNTRETLVYKKGETLFGLYNARDSIKKERKVLIVEGEFDVLSSVREGVGNIVAVKGTALTDAQIRLLKRYAEKILFCFDTDSAGVEAQKRSIEMIEKEGVSAGVILIPEGKDPDELLNENPTLFKQALKKEVHIYDFIIDTAVKKVNPTSVEGKRAVLNDTLPLLARVENEVVKEHYLKKLAREIDSSYESVLKEAEKKTQKGQEAPILARPKIKLSREEILEEYLLALLLQSSHISQYTQQVKTILSTVSFTIPAYSKLFEILSEAATEHETLQVDEFVKQLPAELLPTFDRCYLAPIPDLPADDDYWLEIEKLAAEVKTLAIRQKLKELSKQIRQNETDNQESEMEKLQQEFNRLTKLLN